MIGDGPQNGAPRASDATESDGKPPRTRLLKWPRRIVVYTVGSVVLLTGVVILPLPGPTGTPVILLGLTILGSESPAAIRLRNRFMETLRLRKKREEAKSSGGKTGEERNA